MGQMGLFDGDELPIKYMEVIPKCNFCVRIAFYYGPLKSGHWNYVCQNCSADRDDRFKQGYLLKTFGDARIALFSAIEVHDLSLVVTRIYPRVIKCSLCNTRMSIDYGFVGTIPCKACKVNLRVNPLV